MSGSFINGMIGANSAPSYGDKYTSSRMSSDPYAVVVTFNKPFNTDKTPIAIASVAGAGKTGVTLSLQASNTSLTIQTDSSESVPLYFSVTDRGLGYY